MLMLFIFLFKVGEAFLGRMSIVFYKEVGFSNEQIGEYTKMFGWFVTVSFTLLGSAFNTRFWCCAWLVAGRCCDGVQQSDVCGDRCRRPGRVAAGPDPDCG